MDDDDEKGKQFLKLIADTNKIHSDIVVKLTSLISTGWSSEEIKKELEALIDDHCAINKELNSLS